jgi:uncharacterized glyoxalase superfamily protein PhnB
MRVNRSIPAATVIPVLIYEDVPAAVEWLTRAFGLVERLRIADHRSQLSLGNGAMVAAHGQPVKEATPSHSMLVRVEDADAHCATARAAGARIVRAPADHPYGERQYTALDIGGHAWTFSQTIADVAPEDWGGELRNQLTSQLAN